MIARIRIEAIGHVSAEVAQELNIAADHVRMACYLEGCGDAGTVTSPRLSLQPHGPRKRGPFA